MGGFAWTRSKSAREVAKVGHSAVKDRSGTVVAKNDVITLTASIRSSPCRQKIRSFCSRRGDLVVVCQSIKSDRIQGAAMPDQSLRTLIRPAPDSSQTTITQNQCSILRGVMMVVAIKANSTDIHRRDLCDHIAAAIGWSIDVTKHQASTVVRRLGSRYAAPKSPKTRIESRQGWGLVSPTFAVSLSMTPPPRDSDSAP